MSPDLRSPILPTPKSHHLKDGALSIARGQSLRLCHSSAFPKKTTVDIIAAELADAFGVTPAPEGELTFSIIQTDELPHPSQESYRLEIGDSVKLYARADAGVLHGMATLRQIGGHGARDLYRLPHGVIEDYPDIPYRFASRWLIELEGARMAYDWGDGREKMLERYRSKIDFCMRQKINMVFFDGFEWETDKYPEYRSDVRELNAYARARNVKLTFGGHVIGYGGYPGHTMHGAKGLGGHNRTSYPDGDLYACGKVGDTFDPHFPSITSEAMLNGTCRSNEALNRLKYHDLAGYVRAIEPSVLYLHSEDIAIYEEFRRMWLHRCPACRERWPSNEIASPQGASGALAHGFRWLREAVASVQNPSTGYDGARDCLLVFISPTYSAFYDSDADWRNVADLWTSVSSQLEPDDNILLGVREQFWQREESIRRIPQLAERIVRDGNGHGIFLFSVGGADLYNNSALFSAAPRLNHFFEGAKAIFNFNGGLFASAQEVYNAEYTWNLHSPYGIDEAGDYEAAKTIYLQRSQEMLYPEPDRLLREILQRLYGTAAEEMEAFYRLKGEGNHYPAAILFRLCRSLFKKSGADHDAAAEFRKWSALHRVTEEAIALVDRALQHPISPSAVRGELHYLRDCLTFGSRFCAVIAKGFQDKPDPQLLKHEIQALKGLLHTRYPRNFTSSHEGDMSLWDGYIDRLAGFFGLNDG